MIYAQVGESYQQVGGTCPDGWVEMTEVRPTPDHVAGEEGRWILEESQMTSMRLSENNEAYNAATKAATGAFPDLEKDTWSTQEKQSVAWALDQTVSTPWIDRAAAERGIAREDYLRRTLIKSEQFKVMSAFFTGRRQKFEDAIEKGEAPTLDYELTSEIGAELQQIATDITGAEVEQLHEYVT